MHYGSETGFLTYRGRGPWSWTKRLLNPKNHWKNLEHVVIRAPRWIRVLVMLATLHFRPGLLYLFSKVKLFPSKNDRLTKTANPRDDFEVDWDRSSELPALDRVTVLQRGISFDQSKIDELPGPIYTVNWTKKLDRDDVVYVTGDFGLLQQFIAKEMFPILFMEINRFDGEGVYRCRDIDHPSAILLEDPRIQRIAVYHKARFPVTQTGMPATSGLACIVALSFLAQEIQVYGWDFYLTFAPAHSGYWKSLFKYFVNFHMELQSQFLEMCVYNWHYAYRYSKLPNFRNHGYLSGLEKHPGINNRLDRIFYNSMV